MNKKGFTLMELLTVIVVIAIIMMVVYPSISKIQKNNNDEMYKTYEKMMIEYALVSGINNNTIIKLSSLREKGLAMDDECNGYVNMTTKKAYISCGNKYTTCYSTDDCFNSNLAKEE